MNTATNEVKVNPGSSDELSTQILPEDTPLIFQWLPKSFGSSVPNNKDYEYLQRLVDWSEREPQRKIYLVVNGAGLKQEQIEKLREDLKPTSNIQVVDYQEVSKEEGFEHLKISRGPDKEPFKLSEILAQIYDQQSKVAEILHFVDFLDAMRLEMMRNIEKITSSKNALYFDFDVRPKDGQKIGPISIPGGILLSSEADRDNSDLLENRELENSIIGVNGRSQNIIKSMYKYVEQEFHYYRRIECGIPKGKVYHAMPRVIQLLSCHQEYIDSVLSNIQKFEEHIKALSTSGSVLDVPSDGYSKFRFENYCKNVVITSDKTWRQAKTRSGKELPLHFNNVNNAQDKTTTVPVNDDHVEIPKEATELSSGKELPANHGDLGNACENLYDLNVDVTGDAPGLV